MDDLVAALGCPIEGPAVEELRRRHGLAAGAAGTSTHLENAARGIALGASRDGIVDAVFLFGNVKDGFREYRGALPGGLTFAARRNDVRAVFGLPARTSGPEVIGQAAIAHGGWDRYELRDRVLHFQYAAHTGLLELVTLMPAPDPATATVVEQATARDLPAIAALATRIWRVHYPGIIGAEQIEHMLARRYDLAVMARELEQDGVRYEALYVGGALVAFAAWGTGPKLHKLYVDPAHQRRGLGRRLISHVEELVRARGGRRLALYVNKRNAPAIAAYERCGFRIVSADVADIGGGFVMDDWIMEKAL